MIGLDHYVLDFVGANWMSLYLLLTLLKGLALITKSTTDNKVVTMLSNMFYAVRNKKIPEGE
jgi:hypothetical protein